VVASLLAGLLNHVERHPGLPRLLFHDVASGSQDALRAGLSHLASAQEGFVAEMVREAVKEQALPASVEPSYAGQMFGLLIQGFVLQWLRNGRPDGLSQFAPQLFSFWLSGLQGGGGGQPVPREDEEKREALLALDVRPLIRDGVDPLQVILRHLSQLDSRGLLILRAPFRPAPLLALLSKRGHLLQEMDHDDQGWEVLVSGLNAPPLLALADLPPPGPLQKVLVELETLASGRCLLAHTPRVPQILLGALSEQRRPHCAESLADGTAVVWVGPTE
jgi:hypothetical protein